MPVSQQVTLPVKLQPEKTALPPDRLMAGLARWHSAFSGVVLLLAFTLCNVSRSEFAIQPVKVPAVAVITGALAALFFVRATGRLNIQTLTGLVIIFGIACRLVYTLNTPFVLRQHDLGDAWGHLHYIGHIADTGSLPPSGANQAYHPPLHHAAAAAVVALARASGTDTMTGFRFVQMVMVWLSGIALVYLFRCLRLARCGDAATLAGVALFAFHPYNIYASSYINNDNTLMFFYVVGFYRLLLWAQTKTMADAALFALVAALGIITKKSAVMLLPVFAVAWTLCVACNPERLKQYARQGLAFAAVLLPLPLLLQVRSYSLFGQGFSYCPEPGIARYGRYGNTLHELFHVPFTRLFTHPFPGEIVRDFESNRFFMEYLFKSSLFGEWQFPDQKALAVALTVAALLLLLLIGGYLLLGWRDYLLPHGYLFLINLVVPVLLLISFRMAYPFACTQNFRYLLPTLVSAAFFTGKAVEYLSGRESKGPACAAWGVLAAFCLLSALFVLSIPTVHVELR